jgi:WD40 repeat protein
MTAVWRLPEGASIRRVSDAISPDGRWLVFFSGDAPDWHLTAPITTPLALHVWDLATGTEAFATPVLHPGIREDLRHQVEQLAAEYADSADLSSAQWGAPGPSVLTWHAEDVVLAFLDGVGEVKWSPDGRQLAFVGALDGPSGDVYVLDIDDWQVTRASDEPTHVIRMSWSPKARWILHEGTQYASRAGSSAVGRTTDVSAADGSSQRHVWKGSGIGAWAKSWPDAWVGDQDAIVHSEGHGCGVCDMLRIDVSSGITETLIHYMEAENFVVGPSGRTAAVAARFFEESKGESAMYGVEGVHILALDGSGTDRVHDQVCRVARWDADGLPYIWLPTHGEDRCRTVAFGPGGREQPIDASEDLSDASVSPAGQWRVLYGDSGWRLYDRESIERAAHVGDTTEAGAEVRWRRVTAVSWRPDETGLLWLANGHLWVADLPDGAPRLVGPWPGREVSGRDFDMDMAWLKP